MYQPEHVLTPAPFYGIHLAEPEPGLRQNGELEATAADVQPIIPGLHLLLLHVHHLSLLHLRGTWNRLVNFL